MSLKRPLDSISDPHHLDDQHASSKCAVASATTTPYIYMVCDLPPTCTDAPVALGSREAYEDHYQRFHTMVCTACNKAFPSEHLLGLHVAEHHDPFVMLRRERGDKVYACFVETCCVMSESPQARRAHSIEAHQYPQVSFLRVTQ